MSTKEETSAIYNYDSTRSGGTIDGSVHIEFSGRGKSKSGEFDTSNSVAHVKLF